MLVVHASTLNKTYLLFIYRLGSALKKVVPNISRPKISRHFLMKLPDNFQMREHSRPCRFHIRNYYDFYVLSVKIHGFPIKIS